MKIRVILCLVFMGSVFFACDGGGGETKKNNDCKCEDKNHDCNCGKDNCTCEYVPPLPTCNEACTESQTNHLGIDQSCTHDGKTIQGNCSCTEQTGLFNDIKIRKANTVSVNDMTATIDDIITPAFNANAGTLGLTSAKVAEIRIMDTGKAWVYGKDKVLTINRNLITVNILSNALTGIDTGMPPGFDVDGPIAAVFNRPRRVPDTLG